MILYMLQNDLGLLSYHFHVLHDLKSKVTHLEWEVSIIMGNIKLRVKILNKSGVGHERHRTVKVKWNEYQHWTSCKLKTVNMHICKFANVIVS